MDANTAWVVVGFLAGIAGSGVILVIMLRRAAATQARLTEQRRTEDETRWQQFRELLRGEVATLSREALSANTDDFLKLAPKVLEMQTAKGEQTLEEKKKLIDACLQEMSGRLQRLDGLLQSVDKQRAESHASLKAEINRAAQTTDRLNETTSQLRTALANPQRRGQWGERMAEDVLRLAGFIEGVNYNKQKTAAGGNRPDFTFPMPGGQCVHMDVKFPLANYLKMLDAKEDATRSGFRDAFLKDVRSRIREVTTRDYIDPASGTVDYVLVFIPNEQIYGFIHEQDARVLDDAMRQKVVLCSPLTLYAILAVIRQAIENFRLQESSREILSLLADFKKQWGKYVESMEKLGKRLESAMSEYNELTTTRTKQLDRQLDRIDTLQSAADPKDSTDSSLLGQGTAGHSGPQFDKIAGPANT